MRWIWRVAVRPVVELLGGLLFAAAIFLFSAFLTLVAAEAVFYIVTGQEPADSGGFWSIMPLILVVALVVGIVSVTFCFGWVFRATRLKGGGGPPTG